MSNELKAIIYEPLQESRVVTLSINYETISDIDNVIFNEDGSVCTEFDTFTEHLSDDDVIGFPAYAMSNETRKFLEEIPPVSLKKQKKIERTKQLRAVVQNNKLRNKLKKMRKKAKYDPMCENGESFGEDYIALPSTSASTDHLFVDNNGGSNYKSNNWKPNNARKNNSSRTKPSAYSQQFEKPVRYFQNRLEPPNNFDSTPNSKAPKLSKNKKKKNYFKRSKASFPANSVQPNSNQVSAANLPPAFLRIPWRQKSKSTNKANAKPPNPNPDYIPLF